MAQAQIAPQVSSPSAPAPRRRHRRLDRSQAVKIQKVLTATILEPSTEPASRASCAAAWARVQEAKRIIDGRPLPGQLRPDLAQASAAAGKRIGPPARAAQRIAVLPVPPKPATQQSQQAAVVPQDQSIPLGPEAPSAAGG